MLHGEGAPKLQMDFLLRKYSFVHNSGERFAVATSEKFLCVNPFITERLQKTYPHRKDKIDTLWTWVNTDIFQPQPMPDEHIAVPGCVCRQAGRIQASVADVPRHRSLAAATEGRRSIFDYIGTSDPHRFPEFASIEDVTVRHGFKDAAGMAATLARAHAGILTSEFEGMPRFVLEILAVGRPVVAVHLPQLEPVIRHGDSGFLVARGGTADDMADALADRFIDVRDAIDAGDMDPVWIAGTIKSFTPGTQLARVFRYHQEIQDARGMAVTSSTY